ncbi:MAG: DUF951 domain-containing protein [Flexilinea sp.]
MSETYEIDEVVTLKKTHPCGSSRWVVVRLGAEIGLECLGCHRRIILSRRELHQRMKRNPVKKTESVEQKENL